MTPRVNPAFEHGHCHAIGETWVRETGLHLRTAVLAEKRPGTKVFAVVAKQPIPVFTQPRANPADRILPGELRHGMYANTNLAPCGEAFKRGFFNRTAMHRAAKAGVVHDAAIADIDAVMLVTRALRHEMSTGDGFAVDGDVGS